MIQKLFIPAMENQFVSRGASRDSHHSFPVRISPLDLTSRQLLNKIRINHSKLPSQFFANPRSVPDLQLATRTPSLEVWRKRRQKTVGLVEDNGSKEATRSLKDYKSMERRRQREQERKINELFVEADELGVTFSRLPIRRAENGSQRKEMGKVYLKKVCTEGYEQLEESKSRQGMGLTMKIECLVKARQGISVRKNNHPITTLREIKRQCM